MSTITTVESIAELLAIQSPVDGQTVFVKSYHTGLSMGGGTFTYDSTKYMQNDGGVIVNGWVRTHFESITPLFFGSKGDAVFDDRPGFQMAIDYLRNNNGGELVVPKPIVEYRWKSYDTVNSACLVINRPINSIYTNPITIRGSGNLVQIKVDLGGSELIDSAILLKGGGLYKKFENISVHGGINKDTPNCNYVFKGVDVAYPNLTIRDCQFYVAKEDCFKIQTFVTVLDKLQTAYSKRGIVVDGGGNPQTSITLNSCYALNHDHFGYWFFQTTYCVFNACAADHIINNLGDDIAAYPYYIDIARGVTFNGCGAESSTRILKVRSAQGLVINGIDTLSIGDNINPPNTLIRIDGGASTTIAGLWNQNPKSFVYKLSLGNAVSAESVTILDQSIAPSECTWVSNFRFDNPIRFLLWDYSRKTQDITLANTGEPATNTTNFNNAIKNAYDLELLHDVIIRFPSGDFEINSAVYLASALTRGEGRIRLIGNADGTSRLIINSSGSLSFGRPTTLSRLNYTVENLNLYTMNGGTRGILFFKSDVTFINSKIASDNGIKQWAGDRVSSITLDSNSSIITSMYGSVIIKYSYKSTSAPTNSTRLPVGTRFEASDPNATRIGWINTVDNGAIWLAINAS